ncbi:OPT oligopeptide transporter protein-domain-containing protein [Catenaria anguillulae PL171]|uniref:OPT oligopeptide transporter protein-domain-containing protein n=1 Tax=Catenaria anguillulae PL171 TaxID=765915 RepID=A0A1Y2HUE7_9FUNG|nr:OPT oligopeptide transporter protein-domain-containing protein [Catenaria anguillulae PL171]
MTEKDLKDVKASTEGEVEQQKSFVIDEEFEAMISEIVPTTDDTEIPSLTFRVWVLGFFFCCAVAFANEIFLFRTNQIVLSSFVTVLLSYPLGRIMAATLPSYKLNIFGYELDTNPGPFSVKEHVLINVWGSTGSSGIYAFYNLGAQEVFYDLKLGAFWDLMFIFASSTMGFGLAGICRRFLIRPSHMIWPTVLPSVALFTAFHGVETEANKDDGHKHMSQLRAFGIGAVVMGFLYLIGPGYMSKMLQYIPLLCWIAPKDNLALQRLGSPKWGPGILSLSLDWTTVGAGAMAVPFWSAVNSMASWVIFAWLLVPLAWQGNWFKQGKWPQKTPLNSTHLFDQKGTRFLAGQVIRTSDRTLDEAKFKSRGTISFTPLFASAYFGHISSLVAAITHTALWYGSDIMARVRNAKYDKDDLHCKLIDKYPEVPDSWYWVFFAITGVLITIVGQFGGIDLPWWATLLAIALAIAGTVPTIMIFATAGVTLGLNVVSQFTIGLIVPGRPILMMAFKCVCFAVSWQCRDLLIDLKIGHYMKIPPRHIFISQLVSQFVAGFVCYGAFRYWMDSDPIHKQWVVDAGNAQGMGAEWGGTSFNTYYSASLIWGAIGAKRFFFETQYAPVIWVGALAGLVLPIVLWLGHKYVGGSWWVLAHPAVLLSPNGPGSNNGGYLTSFLVSIWAQFFMYRYRPLWWKRYNYVLATAFDVGTALVALFFSFTQWEFVEFFLNCPTDGECESMHFGTKPWNDWCTIAGPDVRDISKYKGPINLYATN